MQASRVWASCLVAHSSTLMWVAGLMVAQLIKRRPLERASSEPLPLKMLFIALSSVTTVMMMSEYLVTSGSFAQCRAPISSANDCAAGVLTSKTAVTLKFCSLRRRAILAPMRPTPTNPIFSDID